MSSDLEEDLRERPSQPLGTSTMNIANLVDGGKSEPAQRASAQPAHTSAPSDVPDMTVAVVRPEWVVHMAGKEKTPIFAVDIHPDGSRFVTAGGDNKILIWSFTALVADAEERDISNAKKLLCTITNHVAPVNTVRFSPDGRFLASGSDDKYVMIFERQEGAGGAVFGGAEKNVENWKCVANLMGHAADVTMIAWSPDGTRIASSSIDNEVIVWALAGGAPRLLKRLHGHSGLVKGVAFDPIGKYLASQGEDSVVIVWRTSDWEKEAVIEEGKRSAVGAGSFFTRLSWSPDGKVLAIPRVLFNGREVVALADRGTWAMEHQLVGHGKQTVATGFSPQLWTKGDAASKKEKRPYWICAVGSQDATVSVWFTSNTRPKVVVKEMFDQSVVDLAWSRDGLQLLMCSTDGTVSFLRLEGSLRALAAADAADYMRSLYGDAVLKSAAAPSLIIEDPALLGLTSNNNSSGASGAAGAQAARPPAPTAKQIESRANDGRRRITPQFLGGSAPLTVTPAVALPVFAGLASQPAAPAPHAPHDSLPPPAAPASMPAPVATTSSPVASKAAAVGLSTTSPSRPLAMPSAATPMDVTPAPHAPSPSALTTPTYPPAPVVPAAAAAASASHHQNESEDSLLSSRLTGEKRAAEEEPSTPKKLKSLAKKAAEAKAADGKDTPKDSNKEPKEKDKKEKAEGEEKKKKKKKPRTDDGDKERSKDKDKAKEERRKSDGSAAPKAPKLREGASRLLFAEIPSGRLLAVSLNVAPGRAAMSLESISNPGEEGTQVVLTSQGRKLWQERVSGGAILAAGNEYFVAVAANDASLTVFSPTGRRIFAPLILDLPCVALYANQTNLLLAVTRSGAVHVWDVRNSTCVLRQSLGDAALAAGSVERVELIGDVPSISLANRHTLAYDRNMQTFVRIADPWTQQGSEFASLLHMARAVPNPASASGPLSLAPSEGLAGQTIAHLETLLGAAVTLRSPSEYRRWLVAYVRKLTGAGEAAKLKEVCDGLLRRTADERDALLGLDRREVLRTLLQIMSANLELQRLVAQYNDMLKESEML